MNTEKNKSGFQFDEPKVIESIFIKNPQFAGNISKVKSIKFNISSRATELENVDNSDKQSTTVFLTVATNNDLNFKDDDVCFIRITMKANFSWDKGAYNPDEIKQLIKINAPSLLFSYIRTQITELTEKTELPTQYIPFVDFSKD